MSPPNTPEPTDKTSEGSESHDQDEDKKNNYEKDKLYEADTEIDEDYDGNSDDNDNTLRGDNMEIDPPTLGLNTNRRKRFSISRPLSLDLNSKASGGTGAATTTPLTPVDQY
jgi:hypothetical protein